MSDRNAEPQTWPDLAVSLYDRLTGRGAEITYEFDDMLVAVPTAVGSDASTPWRVNGTVKIRTKDGAAS